MSLEQVKYVEDLFKADAATNEKRVSELHEQIWELRKKIHMSRLMSRPPEPYNPDQGKSKIQLSCEARQREELVK